MLSNQENKQSSFLRISCPRCSNNQMIFGRSSLKIKCQKCNKLLTKTTGGKTKIKARIKKIIWISKKET